MGFVEAAAARAVVLLGGVDQVKVDGEGAYHVDAGFQVAAIHNGRDFLIQRLDLLTQAVGLARLLSMAQVFLKLAQSLAIVAQPLHRFKDRHTLVSLDGASQTIAQHANISPQGNIFLRALCAFRHGLTPVQRYRSSALHRRLTGRESGRCSRCDCTLPPSRVPHRACRWRLYARSAHPARIAWPRESALLWRASPGCSAPSSPFPAGCRWLPRYAAAAPDIA